MARILIADDEPGILEFIADTLEFDGHEVTTASDGMQAARALEQQSFALLVTDLRMPGLDGMSLLKKVRAEQPETEVIVLTAFGSVNTAVEAMKIGAFDFLQKPISGPDELSLIVSRALERRGLRESQARAERVADDAAPPLTHGAPSMEPVVRAIERVAPTSATVLLLGESGTGKEVAARTLHDLSARRDGPFMAVNCAALSETLLESELFGHEKGAFTGAHERRRGRIELADGGTFFLDEVAELKPEFQAKLLRVLQERRFERVGGARTIEVDVRWIAATNRDLPTEIAAGRFREDLYHRLAVFPIRLPPLRDRVEDILPIASALLTRACHDLGRRAMTLSDEARHRLTTWHWPGNVRELANVLERAAILADGDTITPDHLWLEASSEPPVDNALRPLVEVERDMIVRTLAAVDGNRRRAAEMLGIAERTLYDKIKRYDIDL